MTTPGSNTLKAALSIQGTQVINLFRYVSRTDNAIGNLITTYAPPIPLRGSVQATQRNLYEYLKLDFQKNYVNLYICTNIMDIRMGESGDCFGWAGRMWQVESNLPWFNADGWIGCICADIGPDPNTYLSLGYFTDPGASTESFILFSGQQLGAGKLLIIDAPVWTYANEGLNGILYSGDIPEDTEINTNVSIGGNEQGDLTTLFGPNVDSYSESTDSEDDPFPGLNSYGVVAGGLRVLHNVRLTISSAAANPVDILLRRGEAPP